MSSDHLQLECVRISAVGVAEMDGARPLIFVARDEIVRIEVAHGSAAERPFVAAILGVVLFAMAAVPLVMYVRAVFAQQPFPVELFTAMVFAIPGWWLVDLSIRSRFFLAVTTRGETRKIVFHKTADRREIEQFVGAAKARFGYA